MKLELTADLVLVEPLHRPNITNAGIELVEAAALAEPRYGEVVEVGPGRQNDEGFCFDPCVKPGDRIFYNVMNAHPVMYNGLGHFLVREHAIFAVIKDDDFRHETLVSEQASRLECPQHGAECVLREANHDGRRGVYCPTSEEFYSEKEIVEAKSAVPLNEECPEHGKACGLRHSLRKTDAEKGFWCPVSEKFYLPGELKGE